MDRKDGGSRDMVIGHHGGHHGEDLHLPEEDLHPLEDLYPLEEDLYPLEGPHARGTHQRGEAHLGGGTHLGGGNHRGRETHQGGGIHQRGEGTPQGGGIGQNQGHLQENMIDIEGNMIDLGQGLPTQGITTDDLQGDSLPLVTYRLLKLSINSFEILNDCTRFMFVIRCSLAMHP